MTTQDWKALFYLISGGILISIGALWIAKAIYHLIKTGQL